MTPTLQLYHTLRHLQARQVYAQLHHRLWRQTQFSFPFTFRRPGVYSGCRWNPLIPFLAPGPEINAPDAMIRGHFRFLNKARFLGWPPHWTPSASSKLWQYHLHYFDWLWSLGFPLAREAVGDWLRRCTRREVPLAWEPYPLSLRLINWCTFFWQRHHKVLHDDEAFCAALWRSCSSQADWLTSHLEHHLRGNHLLENAAALAVIGSVFSGRSALRWFRAGSRMLLRELTEQMLSDGLHFERSPMYHVRVTFLLLLLRAVDNRSLNTLVEPFLKKAIEALGYLVHGDGEIALLNDSAFGINLRPGRLFELANGLGVPFGNTTVSGPWALPAAGYYGCRSPQGFFLVCDAGAIGPDYLPGHGHGDIFSFELSCRQTRILVDSGVFDYVPSEMRRYCRSTAAHNTVALDGLDQSEFWESFRVARRAHPRDVAWEPLPEGFRLRGWHDGYQRLRGRPVHYRQFRWQEPGLLMVRDHIGSRAGVSSVSRLHLHPETEIIRVGSRDVTIGTKAGPFVVRFAGQGSLGLEGSWYCPEFGRRVANKALAWISTGSNLLSGFCVAPEGVIDSFDLRAGASIGSTHFYW